MLQIGPYQIPTPVVAAPMAGVTDKPYRQVCRDHGAGMVVSEMITSQKELRDSRKTKFRSDLNGEPEPVVVQIVGTEPAEMAAAARYNVQNGAQIIDINMGCPAKKVCKKAAGSALLANETLVEQILASVVKGVNVPVTVKIRTGTNPEQRNAVNIARIAEAAGVSAITIHGRTRECKFVGQVEYDSIAAAKQAVNIPVIVNGDIDSPETARHVMRYTNADAVMIGRAAQGQPWLFQQVADYLSHGLYMPAPTAEVRAQVIIDHISAIHQFYGDVLGVRLARKHIKWYLNHWHIEASETTRKRITSIETPTEQRAFLQDFLHASLTLTQAA